MRHTGTFLTPLVLAPLALVAGCATQSVAPPPQHEISERALDTSSAAAVDWRTSKPVTAPHAMVVSAQHLATEVGVEILKRGGNAIDAAVAVGYAEAVVPPCCGHIGDRKSTRLNSSH